MKNFLLLLVAVILAAVLLPIGPIFAVIAAWRYERTWRKIWIYLGKLAREVALSIDRLGNAVCGDMFNTICIERNGYHFGVGRETISSALGKNQQRHTLTWAGELLANTLDAIDPSHCQKAIDEF